MNYIEQINVFWLLDAEHSFNGNESRLYFYLLNLSNSLYWKNPLTNADGYTASVVGISVNTLKAVRNRLQQAGLLTFKPGGHGARNKCVYYIVPAAEVMEKNKNKVSKIDTLSDKSLTPSLTVDLQKADDINKHKQNQTKQNNTSVPASPPPPKKNNGKQKEVEDKEEHWKVLVDTWFSFNKQKFGDEPSFERDDPKIFKRIIGRLKKGLRQKMSSGQSKMPFID